MEEPVSAPPQRSFRFAGEAGAILDRVPLSRVAGANDIVLIVGLDGTVRDASFGDRDLARRIGPSWFDRPLRDIVTVESVDKVRRMLGTGPDDPLAWAEINHPLDGGDLPVRYAAVRLDAGGPLVVLGRDLGGLARLQRQLVDANLSVERDYALFRSAETQARLLFQTSVEPMLILDAASRRIAEINPAAEDLLHRVARRLVGTGIEDIFAEPSVGAVAECLAAVRTNGQARCPAASLRLTDAAVALSAWLMRGAGVSQILLRLVPEGSAVASAAADDPWAVLRHLPEAMLTAADNLDIIDANGAFLDLVDIPTVHQLRSESLSRFVGRHGVDIDLLSSRLQETGTVRRFPTVVRGQYGAMRDVEISVGSTERNEERVYAFLFRPIVAERPAAAAETRKPLRPVSEMTDLVGRVPLRDIVREATDIIEELCIEAALVVTQDNRASAAEMLGLSRQSLYSKLRRYGLGDLPGDASSGT